jgi:gamma-glutamyltranspeptidase/glutathione hydrolase
MSKLGDRRSFLFAVTGAAASSWLPSRLAGSEVQAGLVSGQVEAAAAGNAVLAGGGNAVDAIVTAALVAGVVAVHSTGIGGYGGHLVIAGLPGRKVTAIDFNSTAPVALRTDYFEVDKNGQVPGLANMYGWLAAGVPGVLAGLQLALDRYGTRSLAEVMQPAIKFAREGFPVSRGFASALKAARVRLAADAGSARLFFANGQTLVEGAKFQNPDLAALLEKLADRGSVASFYDGDTADKIAAAFQANGGVLKAADLSAYKAREIVPLSLDWNGYTVHAPPPTAGSLTVLQTLAALKALGWTGKDTATDDQAFVESLRVAWHDRLQLLGDPSQVSVPTEKLLSTEYAQETAERVRAALRDRKPISTQTDGRSTSGTIHLNSVDSQGLTVALTFTHGESLGAQVTVDGLGLVLGHGVSRFDPRSGLANSPGPGKRPLHNMCPIVVTKNDQPVLAIGATGGRRIVNAVTNVLARRIGGGDSLADAVKKPRFHTEGGLTVTIDEGYVHDRLKPLGYAISTSKVATLSAVERDSQTGVPTSAAR